MGPKNVCTALVCATLLAWGSASAADEYRADEFLSLDLSKAVLSPKPLGPAAHFAPVPVEARADRAKPGGAGARRTESRTQDRRAETQAAQTRAEKPRGAARTQADAAARQSAGCPGIRYAGFRSGLANRAASATGAVTRANDQARRIIQRATNR